MNIESTRYIPLTQQPFCCVPACLQMILLRRCLPLFAQEKIGYELGLTVPRSYNKILPGARSGPKPPGGWGTRLHKKEYSLNSFFHKYQLPLKYCYFPASKIDDAKEWAERQIKRDNDVIACFDYGELYGGETQGHISLLDSVSDSRAILIDPEYEKPKFRKVTFKRLLRSMEYHGEDKLGGFWLITSK